MSTAAVITLATNKRKHIADTEELLHHGTNDKRTCLNPLPIYKGKRQRAILNEQESRMVKQRLNEIPIIIHKRNRNQENAAMEERCGGVKRKCLSIELPPPSESKLHLLIQWLKQALPQQQYKQVARITTPQTCRAEALNQYSSVRNEHAE